MSKRVLITGGAGFIGSNLHARCLQEGWSVTSVDDFSNGQHSFVPEGETCFAMDFADERILTRIRNKEFDNVFHLAAVPRVGYSVEHPLETHETNVNKTMRLIDACRGNIHRFIFASSSSVYGGADTLPTSEETEKNPQSPYALQKSIIEDYLKMYSNLYGFDSVALRFFNVFGPNQLGNSPYACAVSAWLSEIFKGGSMRSDGDGCQSRDLCYVDNVTDCCVRAAEVGEFLMLKGVPINVACGERTTNNNIMEYLKSRFPDAISHVAPWRPGDVMHTQASISRAQSILGYEPLVRVWEGIDRTIAWYEANQDMIEPLSQRM